MSLKNKEGAERNPLLLAAKQGDIDFAQRYLNEEGADVNYVSKKVR